MIHLLLVMLQDRLFDQDDESKHFLWWSIISYTTSVSEWQTSNIIVLFPRVSRTRAKKDIYRSKNTVHAISIVLYTSYWNFNLQHYACRHWNSLDSVWHCHCSTYLFFFAFLQWTTNNSAIRASSFSAWDSHATTNTSENLSHLQLLSPFWHWPWSLQR